jgi:PTH1 family peptidyl-tRNA hydrolase
MWLLAGLGNPGTRYAGHRHNIGFMAAEAISAAYSFGAWQKKFHGQICAGTIADEKAILLLPETYMNESGRAVQAAATFHKIPPEKIIVLHDELEIAAGKLRIKQGGGHGGHNGLKSIDAAIGPNYWRLRLGIGRPPKPAPAQAGVEAADFVLSNFNADEKKWLGPFLKSVAAHLPLMLSGNPSEMMNRVTLESKENNHGL